MKNCSIDLHYYEVIVLKLSLYDLSDLVKVVSVPIGIRMIVDSYWTYLSTLRVKNLFCARYSFR